MLRRGQRERVCTLHVLFYLFVCLFVCLFCFISFYFFIASPNSRMHAERLHGTAPVRLLDEGQLLRGLDPRQR